MARPWRLFENGPSKPRLWGFRRVFESEIESETNEATLFDAKIDTRFWKQKVFDT